MEAAREATATSKRLRTRLKSAKVRFDLNPEERKKNMRSSFLFIILQEASESPLFPSLRRLTTELLLTFLILIINRIGRQKVRSLLRAVRVRY